MGNGKAPSAQIGAGAAQGKGAAGIGGGGPDNYDGRSNTNAGTTQLQSWDRKSDTDGPSKVIELNG